MPMYSFKCVEDKCKGRDTIQCSMAEISDLKPKCPKCKKIMVRDFNSDNLSTVIPEHMRATGTAGDNKLRFDKSPSKKKHFY